MVWCSRLRCCLQLSLLPDKWSYSWCSKIQAARFIEISISNQNCSDKQKTYKNKQRLFNVCNCVYGPTFVPLSPFWLVCWHFAFKAVDVHRALSWCVSWESMLYICTHVAWFCRPSVKASLFQSLRFKSAIKSETKKSQIIWTKVCTTPNDGGLIQILQELWRFLTSVTRKNHQTRTEQAHFLP